MSGARGARLIVATSIGAVEALKDQLGVCRWNYALRSIHQSAKNSVMQSYYSSGGKKMTNTVMMVNRDEEKIKRIENSLEKVMGMSCWGPSTVRF